MWHDISKVARCFHLDADRLDNFAEANFNKFDLINECGHLMVSTWHTDDLVAEFKQSETNFEKARTELQRIGTDD